MLSQDERIPTPKSSPFAIHFLYRPQRDAVTLHHTHITPTINANKNNPNPCKKSGQSRSCFLIIFLIIYIVYQKVTPIVNPLKPLLALRFRPTIWINDHTIPPRNCWAFLDSDMRLWYTGSKTSNLSWDSLWAPLKGLDSRLKLVFASPNNTTETHFIPLLHTSSEYHYYSPLSHTSSHHIFQWPTQSTELYSKPTIQRVSDVLYYGYV